MLRRRFAAGLAIASFWLTLSGAAAAQSDADRAQARELGEQGYSALEAKDYAKAAELFGRAEALYHAPTLLLGLARAEAHLGKYVESWEHYHRVVLDGAPAGAPAAVRDAIEAAKQEMESVAAKRAHLTLTIKGPTNPALTLDDVKVPAAALGAKRLVNPGPHVVHVAAEGWKAQDKRFDIAEGGDAQIAIELEPAGNAPQASTAPPITNAPKGPDVAPEPGTPQAPASTGSKRTIAWTAIAVGGAGIVAGLVTGGLAMSARSSASSSPCASGPCASSDLTRYNSDRDSFHSFGTISTITFIAGGVFAAGGVFLLVTTPKATAPSTSAWVRPYVAPTGMGVAGAF